MQTSQCGWVNPFTPSNLYSLFLATAVRMNNKLFTESI